MKMKVTIAIESKHRKKEMPLSQTSNYAKVFAENVEILTLISLSR